MERIRLAESILLVFYFLFSVRIVFLAYGQEIFYAYIFHFIRALRRGAPVQDLSEGLHKNF